MSRVILEVYPRGGVKISYRRITGKFGNFAKIQGILCTQVLNFLIHMINDIAIFAAKSTHFLSRTECVSFLHETSTTGMPDFR